MSSLHELILVCAKKYFWSSALAMYQFMVNGLTLYTQVHQLNSMFLEHFIDWFCM